MKITLNADKHPFYSVGKVLALSYEVPGPVDVDLAQLTQQEQSQIVYGIKTGVLITDQPLVENKPTYSTPHQAPIKQVLTVDEPSMNETLEAEAQEIKKFLSGAVATVKKRLGEVKSIRQLKRLFSYETANQARPTVLAAIQSLLDAHTAQVAAVTGTEEVTNTLESTRGKLMEGTRGLVNLANLTDVVESEEETILINPMTYKEE